MIFAFLLFGTARSAEQRGRVKRVAFFVLFLCLAVISGVLFWTSCCDLLEYRPWHACSFLFLAVLLVTWKSVERWMCTSQGMASKIDLMLVRQSIRACGRGLKQRPSVASQRFEGGESL